MIPIAATLRKGGNEGRSKQPLFGFLAAVLTTIAICLAAGIGYAAYSAAVAVGGAVVGAMVEGVGLVVLGYLYLILASLFLFLSAVILLFSSLDFASILIRYLQLLQAF